MAEKTHSKDFGRTQSLEDLSYDDKAKAIDEVGVLDAPNGGKAAWLVVFGSFCVSNIHLILSCL